MELLWTAGEVPKALLAGGSQSPVRPKDITKLCTRWIDDDPKVICRSDPSSRDFIEPVRSQVSKHPPGMGCVILRGTIRALASARGSVVTQNKKARSLEGPKGPRVAETCESEGPKGPRTS